MEQKRGFGSRIGYIMTLAGFCIGISNMWKFPYLVGANGGGAFLLIYFICVILIGFPMFILEQQLGRSAQLSGIAGMRKLASGRKGKGFWVFSCGWLGVITVGLIAFYFWTILGWNLGYIIKVADGSLYGLSTEATAQTFTDFSGSWGCVACSAVCAVLMWFMLNTDFKKGVEKLCTYALPALFILLIGLAIYSNTLPGSGKGLSWYLTPNFEGVDIFACIQAACVQVFFSVGIGMACAFVYGSYIAKDANLTGDASTAIVMDTCVAILSGLVCTPALFAFGIEPTAGPSLIFVSLPQLFTAMGNIPGRIFGFIFLVAVFLACITSMAAVQEAMVANFGDRFGWSRKKANTITILITFGFSVFVTLNQGNGVLSSLKILKMDFFSFFDMVGSAFGLTLGSLAMLAFVIFVMGFDRFRKEANLGAKGPRIGKWMKWHYQLVLPLILLFVFYCVLRMYFG